MHSLHITSHQTYDGLTHRDFIVADDVTGVLWSPEEAPDRAPLVLLGHGGGRDSRHVSMSGRARLLVAAGFHAAAIDAPGHGGRPRTPADEREVDALEAAFAAGEPVGPIVVRSNADIARRAVPEWRATLDALQALPEIGAGGPVGYFGLNMGTAIGIPLVAAEERISAAVLGMFWYDEPLAGAARRITIPVEFALQWNDEHIPRASGLALFDAIGATEKSLHVNVGAHKEVPRFEFDSAVRFFVRHLYDGR